MNDDDVMVEVVIKLKRNGVLALSISEDAAVPKSTVNTLALGLLSWAQYAITTRTYEKTGERNAARSESKKSPARRGQRPRH